MNFSVILVLISWWSVALGNIFDDDKYEELFFDYIDEYNIHIVDGKDFSKRLSVFVSEICCF